MSLFEAMKEVESPPQRKRIGAVSESIALIANRGGKGLVLEYDGPGIEADIEAVGTPFLDDHGLDDAPDGLSIWEGHLSVTHIHTTDAHEDDWELIGEFRDLTDEEWMLLRETGTPWMYEPERASLLPSEVKS